MKENEETGKFTKPSEVRIVRTLPGPIDRVWDYLVDPEKRAKWFAGGPIEPRKGGKVLLHFRHKDLAPNETPPEQYKEYHETGKDMEGIVTRWDPPHALAYTFGGDGESEAIFELTEKGRDVLLVCTHRAWGGDLPYLSDYGSGWHTHLAHLIALLEGAPPPPFWATHLKMKVVYENLRLEAQSS
jgi:uncharacterized protein YndB with AHSA1/START domain